ncbi:MAG: NPCBM/NEW2 domain-containing protein [Dietzia psychralcaliphila]
MRPSSFFIKPLAVVAASAAIVSAAPATSSAQLPPMPPLPSIEEIQAGAAAAVIVIGAAAAASSQLSDTGGINTDSLGNITSGSQNQEPGNPPVPGTQTTYLRAMQIVRGGNEPSKGSVNINGRAYAQSVYTSRFMTTSTNYQYDLGRNWSNFRATIGLSDTSHPDARYQFRVFVDDQQRGTWTMKLGQAQDININVSGGLRLKLEVTKTAANGNNANAAWGDARVTR